MCEYAEVVDDFFERNVSVPAKEHRLVRSDGSHVWVTRQELERWLDPLLRPEEPSDVIAVEMYV